MLSFDYQLKIKIILFNIIRSVNCEKKSMDKPAHHVLLFIIILIFRVAIPNPENVKHTPKFYYTNNPLLNYLRNTQIKELNELLNTEGLSNTRFWLELASKANQGAFEQRPVFKGFVTSCCN